MAEWIDLHVHSCASDGTLTPTEVVELAKKTNLKAIALTDHDTVDGLKEAIAAGKELGVCVVPGIEVSCDYMGGDVHILGLNIDRLAPEFLDETRKNRIARDRRNEKMIALLSDHGFQITKKQVDEMFGDAVITRAHFARLLYDTGQVSSMAEAFERYIGQGCPCYLPKEEITPKQAMELIKKAKGKAVLAHPILYDLTRPKLEQLVDELISMGLVGIEAVYSTYNYEQETYVKRLAAKKGLFITGGSDFHGLNKPKIALGRGFGKLYIPADYLDFLGPINDK